MAIERTRVATSRTRQPRSNVLTNPIFTTGGLVTHIAARLNTDLNTSGGTVSAIRETVTGKTWGPNATKPTFVLGAINGLPAFDFAASSGGMTTGGIRESSVNQTAYVVFKHSGVGVIIGDAVNVAAYPLYLQGSTFFVNNGVTTFQIATSLVVGTWYLLSYVRTNNSTKVYINGASIGTLAVGTNTASGTVLFNRGNADVGFVGQIAEIATFSGAHTDYQRQKIERGLGDLYGITTSVSLPVLRAPVYESILESAGPLVAHFDMSKQDKLWTDGSLVDTVYGSTGDCVNNIITAAGVSRPTMATNAKNGLSALTFASPNVLGPVLYNKTVPQGFIIYAVAKCTNVAGNNYICDGNVVNAAALTIFGGRARLYSGVILDSTNSITDGEWFVVVGVYNGASSSIFLNGVKTSGSVGTATPTGLYIGGAAIYFTGQIGEVGIVRSSSELHAREIQNALSAKWGISIA